MEIVTRDHIITMEDDDYMSTYTPLDASLNTQVVPSNRFESAASMHQRLHDAGFMFVDRSIVKLGKKIGQGGQGSVYEASVSWPYVDRATKMAVKKFNSELGISQGQYPLELWTDERFHVVRPRAFFLDDDSYLCMIMPLFSGDLRSIIDIEMRSKSGVAPPFAEVMSFGIIMQLALGMKGLHSAGVCHRDLKAANILVRSTPVHDALVAQAGFKFMHMCGISDFENSGDVIGTAFWRAPEVLMSLRTGIPLTDLQWQAADVYSFGMSCYEIVTGEIPFEGKRYGDHDIVINGGRPELPEYVPEDLRKIIMDCWHPNPECRPDFGEILGALMRKAQGDPLLGSMSTSAWELSRGVLDSKSESFVGKLTELKGILWKHCVLNDDAMVGHQNYASWGPKYVHYVEKFVEMVWREDFHWRMTFADYVEFQKLCALTRHSLLGFVSSMNVAMDIQQHNKDMKDHGTSFIEEKVKVLYLARNIYMVLLKIIRIIELDNDNSLTMKEKFEIVVALVIEARVILDENASLELLDNILVQLDPSRTNNEIAIFQRHMKYMVCQTTFEKKYSTLLCSAVGSIMFYFIYTSPTWNNILFQIFGVVLSDSYEIYLGFLCPLLGSLLTNWLVLSFPRYRFYFSIFFCIFGLYISILLFRSYGFRREFGWLGIWYCLTHGLPFSYALLLRLHQYLYVKTISIGASSSYIHRE